MVIHVLRALNILLSTGTPVDTEYFYLPLARHLLENPSLFFHSEESLYVAPGSYIFMALHQANLSAIKVSNLALSLGVMLLLFDAAYRLAGRWAGAGVAWLYALHTSLASLSLPPQSESFFLACVALWLWCAVFLCRPSQIHLPKPSPIAVRSAWFAAVLGGLALGMATLTRGTYLYWIPIAMLACLLVLLCNHRLTSVLPSSVLRRLALQLLLLHSISLLLVGMWIGHNQIAFGRPVIANGAGMALYLGTNPVLGGYEPPYHGLDHDNSLATPVGHLSNEAEERMKRIAFAVLQDTPIAVALPMYVQKLGAFFFFSKAHIGHTVLNERAWRIMLLTLAVLGAWSRRRNPAIWLLTGTILYQAVVHLPVQYNPRYSIGAIDLQLILLAGMGIAALAQTRKPWIAMGSCTLLILFGAFVGAYHKNHTSPIMPALNNGPHQRIQLAHPGDIQTTGLQGNPFESDAIVTAEHPSIIWQQAELGSARFGIFKLGIGEISKDCHTLTYGFDANGEPHREGRFSIRGLAPGQDITHGIAHIGAIQAHGTLTLTLDCPVGSRIRLNELASYQASMGTYYGARIDAAPQ